MNQLAAWILFVLLSCSVQAAAPDRTTESIIGPTVQDFGYQSFDQLLEDIPNLPESQIPLGERSDRWFHLKGKEDFSGREYFFIKHTDNHDVYFAISGFGREIYQVYGPLRPKKNGSDGALIDERQSGR